MTSYYWRGYEDGDAGRIYEPGLKLQPDERADYTQGFADARKKRLGR